MTPTKPLSIGWAICSRKRLGSARMVVSQGLDRLRRLAQPMLGQASNAYSSKDRLSGKHLLLGEPAANAGLKLASGKPLFDFLIQPRQFVTQTIAAIELFEITGEDQLFELFLQGVGQLPIAFMHRHADIPDLLAHLGVGVLG